jgi:hypothetical protein
MIKFLKPAERKKFRFPGSIFLLILEIWLPLLVPDPAAHAYYDIPEHPPTIFKQGERQISSPEGKGTFVFYEHTDPAVSGRGRTSPLTHFSNRFVPADTIPANQPIHMVPRRPIDPANEVANSLYANLKLKRLLEEYAALQTHAHAVLAGLGNPATTSERRSGSGKQPPSLHQLQEDLRQKQLTVTRTIPVIASGPSPAGDTMAVGADAPVETVMNIYRVSDSEGAAPAELTRLPLGSATGTGRGIGTRNTETSLPWIIEAAFSLLAYLQTNKVEAIIYGVLLMSVLMGVSSLRRR